MSFLGDFRSVTLVLGQGVELGQPFTGAGIRLGIVVDDEVVNRVAENAGRLTFFVIRLAVLAVELGNLLLDVLDKFADGDVAIRFVAIGIGLAVEGVEKNLGENAVLVEIERGLHAAVGKHDGARQVEFLVVEVAGEFAIGLFRVGIGNGLLADVEAMKVDVEQGDEAFRFELVEDVLDVVRGHGVLGPVLEGGIRGKIGISVAQRSALRRKSRR